MTFIPEVLSKNDPKNSVNTNSTTSFIGEASSTIGYNSIIVNIETSQDSNPLGFQVLFSNDGSLSSFSTYFSETVIKTTNSNFTYTKSFPIYDNYYKLSYSQQSADILIINSRLSTDEFFSNQNSVNAFTNNTENIYDAFGKLRVSTPYTLLDLKTPSGTSGSTAYLQNQLQICSSFSGSDGATGSKICQNSTTTINVFGNGTFTNQSLKYCVYQPGKSFLIMGSGIMNANNNPSGVKSRIGYFDNDNGLYFEYDSNTGCTIVVKNNGITTSINYINWNIDSMDGNGNSGLNLDYTKAQLFVIDYEWLGVGRVRFGFYAFGRIQYCHEINNINILLGPYTSNINLPLRYELVGINGATASMIQICGSILSEGGFNPIGKPFGVSNITPSINSSTETALIAIRGGGSNFYHQQIIPSIVTVSSTNVNDIFIYRLRLYIAGNTPSFTITYSDVNTNYSIAQYGVTFTGSTGPFTNSIIVDAQTASGRGSSNVGDLNVVFNDIIQLGSNVSNNSSILILTVEGNFAGSTQIYSSLNWVEIY